MSKIAFLLALAIMCVFGATTKATTKIQALKEMIANKGDPDPTYHFGPKAYADAVAPVPVWEGQLPEQKSPFPPGDLPDPVKIYGEIGASFMTGDGKYSYETKSFPDPQAKSPK